MTIYKILDSGEITLECKRDLIKWIVENLNENTTNEEILSMYGENNPKAFEEYMNDLLQKAETIVERIRVEIPIDLS